MGYKIKIRKNATGEVRIYDTECEWQGDGNIWLLTEGNFGCDCNCHDFFEQAGDKDEWEECGCSEDKYTIIEAILESGEIVKIDERGG